MILSAPVAGKARLVKLLAKALGIRVKQAAAYIGELLPSDLEEELKRVDWSVKDVMVGTVRTEEQLRFNLEKGAYYVPSRYMPEAHRNVGWIAIHEADVGGVPGIRWVGQVQSVEERPRGEIPVTMRHGADPAEPYCYFTIRKWELLPQPIEIRDTSRGKPRFTCKFLLAHCTKSWELFAVNSEESYRLLKSFESACKALPNSCAYIIPKNCRLLVADGYFTVMDEQGKVLDQIAVAKITQSPGAMFSRIRDLLYNTDKH